MIFADTGYFIALLKERDELHERALRWAATMREPIVTTDAVLLEVANQSSAPAMRQRLHAFLEHIRSSASFEVENISPALFDAGVALHKARADKEWSLTDCISFVEMEQRQLTRALAHDHHFQQAGFEALLRSEP